MKCIDGLDTRPTTDRIKETLFNMLQNDLADCRFLDLFSGSGGIGIEALSRGAAKAVFVEKAPKAVACIKENLEATRFTEQGQVIAADVITALYRLAGEPAFDIIFMDPPYQKELEKQVLDALTDSTLADEDTMIIIEASQETDFSDLEERGFEIVRQKKYKTNQHVFCRRVSTN